MTLARAYAEAGREVEAEATLLAIVRTPDDPWRWAAAGLVCGEPRVLHYERCPPEEPAQSAASPEPGSGSEAAQQCLARGDIPCVIHMLEGRGRTPSEMQLLIDTYDAMGNQPRRLATMERFIRMFADDPRTPLYEQILAQHTWYRRR